MVKITLVENRSPAEKAGLEAGDRILSINGEAVEDFIDFYFLAAEPLLKIELGPRKHLPARTLTIERDAARPLLGFGISDGPVRKCRNRCLFCFIDQLPRSLRGSLYIKDEDYRYSFLYGNYITGTGLSDRDIRRIIRMGLQPLFISVHATDPDVRRRMLGNPAAADVMPLLGKLTSGGVGFHLQVVLCVGINDGLVLERTITELEELGPASAVSLAVVPVGLTRHREGLPELEPVSPELAASTLKLIHSMQREYLKKRGGRFVFASDEFYLLSGEKIPGAAFYEGFPQLENGVGLIRRSIDSVERKLRRKRGLPADPSRSYRLVTGTLFAPVLSARLLPALRSRVPGRFEVTVVRNSLLGESVTVAGLLAGRDILEAIQGEPRADFYFLPGSAVNEEGLFLDDMSLNQVREKLAPSVVISAGEISDALTLAATDGPR